MGGWLTAIKNLLLNLPTLIGIAQSVIAAFNRIAEFFRRKAAREEQAKAIDKAKETKDTSDVEAIFNPGAGSSSPPADPGK